MPLFARICEVLILQMVQRRRPEAFLDGTLLSSDDVLVIAGALGKTWKRFRRRRWPGQLKNLMLGTLLELRLHIAPTQDAAIANVCVQKAPDVDSTMQDPYESNDDDNANDDNDCNSDKADEVASSIGSHSESRNIARKVITFGGAEIHEFTPPQHVGTVEVRDNVVGDLKRDIGDLQIQIQRMTDSHRSEVSGLRGKLKDVAQLMADAHNQIESNGRTMLTTLASSSACPRHQ